ncbi:MAG: hypothetical protein STSR0007_07000 [Thermovirga sp.]
MRFIVLILSLGTLFLYGRAIAGLWGYMAGQPRPDMLLSGLLGGTASAAAAMLLWRKKIKNLDWISEEKSQSGQ